MWAVAQQLHKMGRADEQLELIREVVDRLREHLGDQHERTLAAEMQLADCLDSLGRPEEAVPWLEHVVAARTLALGPDPLETVSAMAWLAHFEERAGHLDKARLLLEQVNASFATHGATETVDGLRATSNLARVVASLNAIDQRQSD